MGRKNSGIIHLLPLLLVGILIIAVGAGMFYFGQKSNTPIVTKEEERDVKDEASDWKVYNNETFGYSLDIPRDWEAVQQGGDDASISIRPIGADNIPVIISAAKTDLTVDEFIDGQLSKGYPRKDSVVNGYPAIFVNNTVSVYEYNAYYLKQGAFIYTLNGSTLDSENLKIFDQILSTFEFVD